jgi:hypothetical protein
MGGVRGASKDGLKIGFGEAGDLHLVFQEAEFEGLIAVEGDDEAFATAGFGEDVVAAVDADELPAVASEDADEVFAGDLLHGVGIISVDTAYKVELLPLVNKIDHLGSQTATSIT